MFLFAEIFAQLPRVSQRRKRAYWFIVSVVYC